MSFITTGPDFNDLSEDFVAPAKHMAELAVAFDTAAGVTRLSKMELIGYALDQRNKFPQRSPEATYINKGLASYGWSKDVISENYTAYKFRQKLYDKNVDTWTELADACSPTQLLALSRADAKQTTTVYCAAKFLQKNGEVPTVKQINGHAHRNTNDNFKFFSTIRAEKNRLQESESSDNPTLNPDESEIRDNPTLNTVESEFRINPTLTSESDSELRKKCHLVNNMVKPEVRPEVESSSFVSSSLVKPEVTPPLLNDSSKLESCVAATASSSYPVIDVTPTLEQAATMSGEELYELVERNILKNYKNYSSEDMKWLERIDNLFKKFLKM